jgi:hypothetical protein
MKHQPAWMSFELIMVHQQTLLLADGFKVIVLDVPRGGGNA